MVTLDNLVVTTALPRIRIDLGARIFSVTQVKQDFAFYNTHACGSNCRTYRVYGQQSTFHQEGTGAMQCHVSACDGGCARASIGLQDIAIKNDSPWPQGHHVHRGTQ